MNSRILPILLAAASLLLAACVPESKNPLSTPATSAIDARLEGIYVQRKEKGSDNTLCWHFHNRGAKPGADGKARLTPWIDVLSVEHEKQNEFGTESYCLLATRLGGHDYLSIMQVSLNGERAPRANYIFARYEINWHGDLRIWLLDHDQIAAAVTSGKLRGKVTVGKFAKDVLITDTTPRLAAFVAASDPKKLFGGKPLVLHRVAR